MEFKFLFYKNQPGITLLIAQQRTPGQLAQLLTGYQAFKCILAKIILRTRSLFRIPPQNNSHRRRHFVGTSAVLPTGHVSCVRCPYVYRGKQMSLAFDICGRVSRSWKLSLKQVHQKRICNYMQVPGIYLPYSLNKEDFTADLSKKNKVKKPQC